MRATERNKSAKTDEIEAVSRPFFVEMCHGKIVDLQKITVFLEQLDVQTFVSRRGHKFAIRIDERKWLVKVSSNFVELELHSCNNNDPTRVCGRLFFRARAAVPERVFDQVARESNTV